MSSNDAKSAAAPAAAIACPNCRAPMQSEQLERHDAGTVRVDLCFGCAGIWFDHLASVQLAPGAVISLFKEIYAHRSDARKARDAHLKCPRCEGALVQSFDLARPADSPISAARPATDDSRRSSNSCARSSSSAP